MTKVSQTINSNTEINIDEDMSISPQDMQVSNRDDLGLDQYLEELVDMESDDSLDMLIDEPITLQIKLL